MIGDRAEPLAAIYPADAQVYLVAALSGNDFSLQTLTNKLVKAGKVRVLPVAKKELQLFRNLNVPADLA
jgi:molybdopterin-guanine dinucleotide biosynthesis protein A